jgi:hypothetical protein
LEEALRSWTLDEPNEIFPGSKTYRLADAVTVHPLASFAGGLP